MKEVIKELYISGKSIDEISAATNLSRQNIYYHKKADFKKGCDWDALRLNVLRGDLEIENKESIFLNTLISSFDKFLLSAKSNELDEGTLDKLYKYAKTYWQLKSTRQINEANIAYDVAKASIKQIADYAISQKKMDVANWLADNADEIIKVVLAKYKDSKNLKLAK